MKKLLHTFILSLIIPFTVLSQSCLPEGITFSTQEEIDNFQTNFPNCTEIEGSLNIEGDDITNLNALNVLTFIGGRLNIISNPALISLEGLDNVTSIVGRLDVLWNPALTSLEGLDNVTSIGGVLKISSNHNLTSLTGLENLISVGEDISISANSDLTSISALGNLTHIGGNLFLKVPITSLPAFENLTSIGGYVHFKELDITNLTGLDNLTSIGGFLMLYGNDALTSITALSNLTSIGGYLRFSGNDALTSLEGIENIDGSSITELYILGNYLLTECEAQSICDYLDIPGGHTEISNNADGCKNQAEVEEACNALYVDEVSISNKVTITPNPFSTFTTLEYILKQPGEVYLSIYNQFGQLLYFRQEIQTKGKQLLIWNTVEYPDGIYYFRLQADNKIANGKMIKR